MGGGVAMKFTWTNWYDYMNKIIKFILKVPILTCGKFIYKELNVLEFEKLLTKCSLLLSLKHKMYLPSCIYNYNIVSFIHYIIYNNCNTRITF